MKYDEIKKLARDLRNNQTPFEKVLWKKLKNRQLSGYKFLRQHPILYDREWNDLNFFIPDFYCPELKLAIEIDGGIHDDKADHDRWREKILLSMNIKVIRFKNEEMFNIERVLARIEGYCQASTRTPAPPCQQGGVWGG